MFYLVKFHDGKKVVVWNAKNKQESNRYVKSLKNMGFKPRISKIKNALIGRKASKLLN